MSMQPLGADDVAESLSHIVYNRPAQCVFEIAGPDRYDLADLALKILAANEEKREVVVDPDVRYLGAHFAGEVLTGARQRFASTRFDDWLHDRSEEHTSELQSLMRISYAVFCLKTKNKHNKIHAHVL